MNRFDLIDFENHDAIRKLSTDMLEYTWFIIIPSLLQKLMQFVYHDIYFDVSGILNFVVI